MFFKIYSGIPDLLKSLPHTNMYKSYFFPFRLIDDTFTFVFNDVCVLFYYFILALLALHILTRFTFE